MKQTCFNFTARPHCSLCVVDGCYEVSINNCWTNIHIEFATSATTYLNTSSYDVWCLLVSKKNASRTEWPLLSPWIVNSRWNVDLNVPSTYSTSMELRNCKLVLQDNITIFSPELLTSKNCSFEVVNTCTALKASWVSSIFVGEEAVGKSALYKCLYKWEYSSPGFVVLCESVCAVFHTSPPLLSFWQNYLSV
jgi:hypothetical protein